MPHDLTRAPDKPSALTQKPEIGCHGHYRNPKLPDSQFAILERQQDALRLDAEEDPAELARSVRATLNVGRLLIR